MPCSGGGGGGRRESGEEYQSLRREGCSLRRESGEEGREEVIELKKNSNIRVLNCRSEHHNRS